MKTRLLALAVAIASLLITGCGQVNTGEAGFFTRWGEITSREPLSEGLHIYEPFGTDLVTYNIKNQTIAVRTEVFTKDLQSMKLEMSVTFNLDRSKVIQLHAKTGRDYARILISPTVLNSAKDVLGKMEAGEIVEKREAATKSITETLSNTLSAHGINIVLVNITDIDYSDAYERAVEAKQVAQQDAQREKNETLKIKEKSEQEVVKAEAEARVVKIKAEADALAIEIKAKAEAQSIEMRNKALESSKSLIEYTLAQQWDGKLPVQMLGSSPVPFINIDHLTKDNK